MQSTDNVFIECLWRSIKYENVYLHGFDTVDQARIILSNYITFYNHQRHHQSLNYHTPNDIYYLRRIPTKQELFHNFRFQHNLKLEANVIPKIT